MSTLLIVFGITAFVCCVIFMLAIIGIQGAQNTAAKTASKNGQYPLLLPKSFGLCPTDPSAWQSQDIGGETFCVKPGTMFIYDNTGKMIGAQMTNVCPFTLQTINGVQFCVDPNANSTLKPEV